MDFRLQTLARGAYSAATTDALILVLAGDAASLVLDDALKAVVQDAVGKGDFEIKAGRSLYIHRPAGVKAPRLVLVGAKDASAKSFKAAVAAGVNAIKALGVKAATVAVGFEGELTDDHAEAFATAAEPALYVYRHTKPSAPKASSLVKLTLAVAKAETKATQAGLARGQAISAGVALARELGNKPANVMTPTQLGEEAKQLGKDFGLKVEVMDKKAIEKLGMGSFLGKTSEVL
jgi:leucyl aminopeptidase